MSTPIVQVMKTNTVFTGTQTEQWWGTNIRRRHDDLAAITFWILWSMEA
jgi:hypothetical protein